VIGKEAAGGGVLPSPYGEKAYADYAYPWLTEFLDILENLSALNLRMNINALRFEHTSPKLGR